MGKKPVKKESKGLWIPNIIIEDTSLTVSEKFLLAEIDSLDQGEGCWASNAFFAKKLNTTSQVIANMLTKLKKNGWIATWQETEEDEYGGKVVYRFSCLLKGYSAGVPTVPRKGTKRSKKKSGGSPESDTGLTSGLEPLSPTDDTPITSELYPLNPEVNGDDLYSSYRENSLDNSLDNSRDICDESQKTDLIVADKKTSQVNEWVDAWMDFMGVNPEDVSKREWKEIHRANKEIQEMGHDVTALKLRMAQYSVSKTFSGCERTPNAIMRHWSRLGRAEDVSEHLSSRRTYDSLVGQFADLANQ